MPILTPSRNPIPLKEWGSDHWSTLLYLESVYVDGGGKVVMERMRANRSIHPELAHRHSRKEYPTKLRSREIANHDDWSCVEDMLALGLLVVDVFDATMPPTVIVQLTSQGWYYAGLARRSRAETQGYKGLYERLDAKPEVIQSTPKYSQDEDGDILFATPPAKEPASFAERYAVAMFGQKRVNELERLGLKILATDGIPTGDGLTALIAFQVDDNGTAKVMTVQDLQDKLSWGGLNVL